MVSNHLGTLFWTVPSLVLDREKSKICKKENNNTIHLFFSLNKYLSVANNVVVYYTGFYSLKITTINIPRAGASLFGKTESRS